MTLHTSGNAPVPPPNLCSSGQEPAVASESPSQGGDRSCCPPPPPPPTCPSFSTAGFGVYTCFSAQEEENLSRGSPAGVGGGGFVCLLVPPPCPRPSDSARLWSQSGSPQGSDCPTHFIWRIRRGRRSILSPKKMSVFPLAAGCEECVFHLCCLSVYIYIVPLTVLGLHLLKGKRVNV